MCKTARSTGSPDIKELLTCYIVLASVKTVWSGCYKSVNKPAPDAVKLFIRIMAICKTVNIKPEKTCLKIPRKFLYGF